MPEQLAVVLEPRWRRQFRLNMADESEAMDHAPDYGAWCGVFHCGDDRSYLWLPRAYRSEAKQPLILFFHGRGGTLDDNNFLSEAFAEFRRLADANGYVVAVPDYGGDSWMNEEADRRTLRIVVALKQSFAIDQEHLYLMGVSMGGTAALIFTMRHAEMVAATCSIMPVTDIAELYHEQEGYRHSLADAFRGSPAVNPEAYRERSAVHNVERIKQTPLLLIHGEQDALVSIRHSETLAERLAACGALHAKFIPVPGCGHSNDIIRGQERNILHFFRGHRLDVPNEANA